MAQLRSSIVKEYLQLFLFAAAVPLQSVLLELIITSGIAEEPAAPPALTPLNGHPRRQTGVDLTSPQRQG